MKFLIINTPNGKEAALDSSPEAIKRYSEKIKGLLDSGDIEKAWVLHAGGHAYVLSASNSEELACKLRANNLHPDSHSEVIPVMEALDFFNGVSKLTR